MGQRLGSYTVQRRLFEGVEKDLQRLSLSEADQPEWHRFEAVNRYLLQKIQAEPEPAFLLPAVLDFIDRVDQAKLLKHYTFNNFELWLNQFSLLSFEDNYHVRAKIVGKRIERADYQILFPIGTGKVYEGSHFVTAHKSPDLDTTIASFWGWMDAFGARVSQGLHLWNVPGGPPHSQIEVRWLFFDLFHPSLFVHLAKSRTALSVTGEDLMTQRSFFRKKVGEPLASIDHERENVAVVVVNSEGAFLGDWRSFDVEGVRQLILLVSSFLRWFENQLHLHLISQFAREELFIDELTLALRHLFGLSLKDCEPASEFSSKQKKEVETFLGQILGLSQGLRASFQELRTALLERNFGSFLSMEELLERICSLSLFDEKGKLKESRPAIFLYLEHVVQDVHRSIVKIRGQLETLEVALKTKREVFGHAPTYITLHSDVEEIRLKMNAYAHLTVVAHEGDMAMPLGVVHATDLRKNVLGTVSLRDFCNREEMTIPPYLEVISVVDHHKSSLSTYAPPLALISDAQSSNTLVARLAFELNDRYSSGQQTLEELQKGVEKELTAPQGKGSLRLAQRLLQRYRALQNNSFYYIHPDREFIEYLHFLYGILDDTDLLSKVTILDLECVASLLNRLKSLAEGEERELVSLDDLPRDSSFLKAAAKRLLQNEDLYSLYQKVYQYREKDIEESIQSAALGKSSPFFVDTKEQNGCCRVGQTKLFARNMSFFATKADACRRTWLHTAQGIFAKNPEVDLHMHMISTVVHGEEVYAGMEKEYSHKDELWIWIPHQEIAIEHLKWFLSAFQASPGLKNQTLELFFPGDNSAELALLFKESLPYAVQQEARHPDSTLGLAILRFRAGLLNSRKAMVSPFLPAI